MWTAAQIAGRLALSRRTVSKHLQKLQRAGLLGEPMRDGETAWWYTTDRRATLEALSAVAIDLGIEGKGETQRQQQHGRTAARLGSRGTDSNARMTHANPRQAPTATLARWRMPRENAKGKAGRLLLAGCVQVLRWTKGVAPPSQGDTGFMRTVRFEHDGWTSMPGPQLLLACDRCCSCRGREAWSQQLDPL